MWEFLGQYDLYGESALFKCNLAPELRKSRGRVWINRIISYNLAISKIYSDVS